MSKKLLKVALGTSVAALIAVSSYAFSKGDVVSQTESAITDGTSETVSELFNKADNGDASALAALKIRAEAGEVDSQLHLGLIYMKGNGVPRSFSDAYIWFKKAADQGDETAKKWLSVCPHENHVATNLSNKANRGDSSSLTTLKAKAEAGDVNSQLSLGLIYLKGNGVAQSDTEAFVWFKKAAEQGDKLGQFRVGEMYYYGNGVAQSYADAFTWYKKAAEQGLDSAQFMLGSLYESGQGVAQSDSHSFIWYKKAAEQGVDVAQLVVGLKYYDGRGIGQSYPDAVLWLKKAADQNIKEAQCRLGVCYFKGQGVAKSVPDAAILFKKAANQGDELAKKWLSICSCETADLLTIAYDASVIELTKSQQNKEKYLYQLGKANTTLQAWSNFNTHLMNCSECGSDYKTARMQQLHQAKSHLDAMHMYLENAVSRGLNGDNDSEDTLFKMAEALDKLSKPLKNLPPIQI